FVVFFFQAEDGIRDFHVTGVQTCALPISTARVLGRMSKRRSWTRWGPIGFRRPLRWATAAGGRGPPDWNFASGTPPATGTTTAAATGVTPSTGAAGREPDGAFSPAAGCGPSPPHK